MSEVRKYWRIDQAESENWRILACVLSNRNGTFNWYKRFWRINVVKTKFMQKIANKKSVKTKERSLFGAIQRGENEKEREGASRQASKSGESQRKIHNFKLKIIQSEENHLKKSELGILFFTTTFLHTFFFSYRAPSVARPTGAVRASAVCTPQYHTMPTARPVLHTALHNAPLSSNVCPNVCLNLQQIYFVCLSSVGTRWASGKNGESERPYLAFAGDVWPRCVRHCVQPIASAAGGRGLPCRARPHTL